ncbi:hypothetical protein [Subtercola boreus]|uniref:hypothetical protein n=1 Tax=Subtercola boreus TaxID=120213 RepID=UPI001152B650|nr:hypothetical protein [Subtercola boreus]
MSVVQKNEVWLKDASPQQISDAYDNGELDFATGTVRNAAGRPITEPPMADADYAAELGITVEEYGHINSLDVIEKIVAHHEKFGFQ